MLIQPSNDHEQKRDCPIQDARFPASYSLLSSIRASRELSNLWISALEDAWHKAPDDKQVIKNIQATVAGYIQTGRSADTAREISRILALYRSLPSAENGLNHTDISISDVTKGIVQGAAEWIEDKTRTGDMNLRNSQARGDPMQTLLDTPHRIYHIYEKRQHIKTALSTVINDPSLVPKAALEIAYSASQTMNEKSDEAIIKSISSANPAQSMGAMAGAVSAEAVNAIVEAKNPLNKVEKINESIDHVVDLIPHDPDEKIHKLAKLLGEGSQPKEVKKLNNYEDELRADYSDQGFIKKLEHHFSLNNFIDITVINDTMALTIRRTDDYPALPSATEMFLAAKKVMDDNGVQINKLAAYWPSSGFNSNNLIFWQNYLNKMTPENAVRNTPSGKMAARIGLTEVEIPDRMSLEIRDGNDGATLTPTFRRPPAEFPGTAWEQYREKWTSSMGQDMLPRDADQVARSGWMQKLTDKIQDNTDHQQPSDGHHQDFDLGR